MIVQPQQIPKYETRSKGGMKQLYRETVRELNNLNNRELADLGIGRSAIKSIALEAAYGN